MMKEMFLLYISNDFGEKLGLMYYLTISHFQVQKSIRNIKKWGKIMSFKCLSWKK